MQLLKTISSLCLASSLVFTTPGYAKNLKNEQLETNSVAPLFFAPDKISPKNWRKPGDLPFRASKSIDITTLPINKETLEQSYRTLELMENIEQDLKSTPGIIAFQDDPAFTPICPTLDINTSYTLSGTATGEAYCYHFIIPKRAKTTVFITDQSIDTDFTLSLIKDDGQNNLSVLGTSNNSDNADELLLALTEPGHYYWFMEANNSVGEPVSFGAVVNTEIDRYEVNDTYDLSTIVPDGMHTYVANSDSSFDHDYYQFTAIRGQDVGIFFTGTANNSNRWILEVLSGGQWMKQNSDSKLIAQNLVPNQRIDVRIRPNPAQLPTTQMTYRLVLGSKPASSNVSLNGESDVIRIPYSAPVTYMTTQAYRELRLNVNARDSKGGAIPGLTAVLHIDKQHQSGKYNFTSYSIPVNANGSASRYINLGTCSGDYQVDFEVFSQGYRNTWRTDFNRGAWYLDFNEFPLEGGHGSDQVPVTFGQLCSQRLISSVRD